MREAQTTIKFSRAQVERVIQVWGKHKTPVNPGMTTNEVMYNAGVSAVLDWLVTQEGHLLPRSPRDPI